jgi:hypothetical protein
MSKDDFRSIETQLLPCEPGWRVLFVDGHGESRIEPLVCWARVEYQRHDWDDGWVLDYVQIEPRALVDRDVWNGACITDPTESWTWNHGFVGILHPGEPFTVEWQESVETRKVEMAKEQEEREERWRAQH